MGEGHSKPEKNLILTYSLLNNDENYYYRGCLVGILKYLEIIVQDKQSRYTSDQALRWDEIMTETKYLRFRWIVLISRRYNFW